MQRVRALFQKAPPHSEWLSANDLIIEAVTLTRSEADRNRVSLTTDLSNDLPRVKAARNQLQQVIVNLIMNAIEAVSAIKEAPREVLVSSARNGSRAVLVVVRDSGTGLAPEQLDQVFDAFLYDQVSRHGHGVDDQPLDCRGPWRTAVGHRERAAGCGFSVHVIGEGGRGLSVIAPPH